MARSGKASEKAPTGKAKPAGKAAMAATQSTVEADAPRVRDLTIGRPRPPRPRPEFAAEAAARARLIALKRRLAALGIRRAEVTVDATEVRIELARAELRRAFPLA